MHTSHQKKPNRITKRGPVTSASEMPAPMEYRALEALPVSVVYTMGGTLLAHLPVDPDIPSPVHIGDIQAQGRKRLTNGLTPRADCMARLMARGVSGSDAYRAAYGDKGRTPHTIAARVNQIMGYATMATVVRDYRERMERERQQATVGMRDFVTGRLVHEAQTADNAPSRIRALELLGKTQAMFTDVKRTERAINPKDLDKLKGQLEQRLRSALSRLVPGLSHTSGTAISPESGGNEVPATPPGGQPPYLQRDPRAEKDTEVPAQPAHFTAPHFLLGPHRVSQGGPIPGKHRAMVWEDL